MMENKNTNENNNQQPGLNTQNIEEANLIETTPAPEETITIPKHQLIALLEENEAYRQKEDQVAEVIVEAMTAFGLIDKATGQVNPDLKNGNVMKAIINAVRENVSISDIMFNRKKAEAELMQTFGFLSKVLPMFEDYARRKQQ